jgi:hypothetical protein
MHCDRNSIGLAVLGVAGSSLSATAFEECRAQVSLCVVTAFFCASSNEDFEWQDVPRAVLS